jgi:hypothetical protein
MASGLEFPRNLHKPGNVCLIVEDEKELKAALKQGWSVDPVLTDEQKANVKKAQIAAGEIAE